VTDTRDPNWAQVGHLLPIETLAPAFAGPVILAVVGDAETIRCFSPAGADRSAIEHVEHERDEQDHFRHTDDGEPITKKRTLKPTHWAFAEIQ
jgi:hypothetical protein